MLKNLIYIELSLELLLLGGCNDEELVNQRNALRKELNYYKPFSFVTFFLIGYEPELKYKGILVQEYNLVYYKDEHNGEISLRVDEDCVILE